MKIFAATVSNSSSMEMNDYDRHIQCVMVLWCVLVYHKQDLRVSALNIQLLLWSVTFGGVRPMLNTKLHVKSSLTNDIGTIFQLRLLWKSLFVIFMNKRRWKFLLVEHHDLTILSVKNLIKWKKMDKMDKMKKLNTVYSFREAEILHSKVWYCKKWYYHHQIVWSGMHHRSSYTRLQSFLPLMTSQHNYFFNFVCSLIKYNFLSSLWTNEDEKPCL